MNRKVNRGLRALIKNDVYLLENNISERSITHKLAEYYQDIYPLWNVDCEFNKNLELPKGAEFNPEDFLHRMADLLEMDSLYGTGHKYVTMLREGGITLEEIHELRRQLRLPGRIRYDDELDAIYFLLKQGGKEFYMRIYPDIIIHKRGTRNNHIVIEVKKSSNSDNLAKGFDLAKLITLVTHSDYKYKRGYFIEVPTKNNKRYHDKITNHKSFSFEKEPMEERVYKVRSKSII